MFIEQILHALRQEFIEKYNTEYQKALLLGDEKLYTLIIEYLQQNQITSFKKNTTFTYLPSCGCPYSNASSKHYGCSFCNYVNDNTKEIIKMKALKALNPELYKKAVLEGYKLSKTKNYTPSLVEFLSGFDTLNDDEFNEDITNEIFYHADKNNWKSLYCVFVTRVDSISEDKLLRWKNKVGSRVIVEFGVEVMHEWIRNYWLNKNISNQSINKAIEVIHAVGYYAQADVLIGMPGLTQLQSIELFKETCTALLNRGVDYILCSPLVHKAATLQSFIDNHYRNNDQFIKMGISNGNFASLPDIYTVFDAIYETLSVIPELKGRFLIGPVHFPIYFDQIKAIYRNTKEEVCVNEIISAITDFGDNNNFEALQLMKQKLNDTEHYRNYKVRVSRSYGMKELLETILKVSRELSKTLWKDEWRKYYFTILNDVKCLEL